MSAAPNNSVLVVPVPVSRLGLPAGQTAFRYRVVGQSRFWGTIDTTGWAKYDIANLGVTFADGLSTPPSIFSATAAATTMYPDLAGTSIGVTFNAANFAANGSQGVLLLHHFGEGSQRTEVLPVVTGTFGFLALKGGACDNSAIDLSGSGNAVTGNVHSNGGIKISGSKNTVSGTLTYRTGCRASVKGLTATEDEIDARVEEIAGANNTTPAKVYASLQKAGRLESIERELTEKKVFSYLESQSEIT